MFVLPTDVYNGLEDDPGEADGQRYKAVGDFCLLRTPYSGHSFFSEPSQFSRPFQFNYVTLVNLPILKRLSPPQSLLTHLNLLNPLVPLNPQDFLTPLIDFTPMNLLSPSHTSKPSHCSKSSDSLVKFLLDEEEQEASVSPPIGLRSRGVLPSFSPPVGAGMATPSASLCETSSKCCPLLSKAADAGRARLQAGAGV